MATANGAITPDRKSRAVVVIAALWWIALGSAAVAATPEEVVSGVDDGVFIEPGAESVDTERLDQALRDATEAGLDLTVVVLADPTEAVSFAGAVNDRIAGTILVFTPDSYGVASTELAQGTLDDALLDAADALQGPSVVDAVAAFVEAARPSTTNWGLIIVAGVLTVAVVAVTGRLVERRATRGRRAATLQKRWGQLEARADALADPILDLSTRVELDGRAGLAEHFRVAASLYGEIRDTLARPPTADAVDAVESDLDQLQRRIERIETELDSAST